MDDTAIRKRVLITGATGYIGRRLTHRLLADGAFDLRLMVRNARKVMVAVADKVE
ncbi:MAG TPA: DUF2867 domain-containing protein, partial [Desulfofustis sp.]|nr:DUF2867 domain-containing protein [Desulfofustis sp.]